ncbi:MAG: hypothetical protein ABIT01_06300 [Thermoanaerobaculia bacterium]
MKDTTIPSPGTAAPFVLPRSEDDPDEIDAAELVAECDVLTATSEIVGYRTTLALKDRKTGTVIRVRTFSDEDFAWACVEPETTPSYDAETEERAQVAAFEDAALAAVDTALPLVEAARRVLDASSSDIWVDTKICPESAGGMAHMNAALTALRRSLKATAPMR